jgi:hypothetical protein
MLGPHIAPATVYTEYRLHVIINLYNCVQRRCRSSFAQTDLYNCVQRRCRSSFVQTNVSTYERIAEFVYSIHSGVPLTELPSLIHVCSFLDLRRTWRRADGELCADAVLSC